jgi:hypothetical protein
LSGRHPERGAAYHWYSERLPNGWTACIQDDSQVHNPPQQTNYMVSAISRLGIKVKPHRYTEFALAKNEAVRFAMSQPLVPPMHANPTPEVRPS